jgi:6-phosphogluconolactonase (cycloisomerase 2 family)
MSPATVAAGTSGAHANSVAVDPSARYAYAVTQTDGTISQWTIGSNGALTLKALTAVLPRGYPDSIAIDPSGKFAYVSNLRADPTAGDPNHNQYTVAQFSIDAASGALTQMNPGTVLAESGPRSVVVALTGGRVYAVCFDHGQVSQYAIGSGGALTPLSPATVAAGPGAISIAVDPSGRCVHVANSAAATADISQYAIDAGGTLTPLSSPTAVAGSGFELHHSRSLGPARRRDEQHRQHGVAVHGWPVRSARRCPPQRCPVQVARPPSPRYGDSPAHRRPVLCGTLGLGASCGLSLVG